MAGRLRREWQDRPAGAVEHVLTVSPAQEHLLADTLASLRAQSYRRSRIRVLRWGVGPGWSADAEELPALRDLALRTTTAPMLRLVEAGDSCPPRSTALLVRLLRRSQGNSAAGVSLPVRHRWRDEAFAAPGTEPGLADRLLDVAAWRRAGVDFASSSTGRYADPVVALLEADGRAAHTDAVVHHDHGRATGLPFGHQRRWAAEADDWCAAVGGAIETGAGPAWAGAVVDRRLRALLTDVESLTDAQWRRLVGLCGRLESLVGPEQARVEARILLALVAGGDRAGVTDLVVSRWRAPDDLPTDVVDGRVLALLAADRLPADVRRLGERETPLVLRPQRRSGNRLELVGFVRGVSMTGPPAVRVTAADPRSSHQDPSGAELVPRPPTLARSAPPMTHAGCVASARNAPSMPSHRRLAIARPGRRSPGQSLAAEALVVTSRATPAATRVAGEAEHDHDHGWLSVELPSPAPPALAVELTVRGITRRALVDVPPDFEAAPPADPRDDDEIGPRAQRRLQQWYAGAHRLEPDLAYFQSYTGQPATDSPLAIHRALRRARPDIRVRWLVERADIPVPEGAEPVLLRSREWYRTLATARWLVTNIEMDLWFRRKPGQAMLQTFHGNPSKLMGLAAWRAAGLTPGQIERSLDHGPRNWTMLVSPSPEMTRHYREQFDYHGPVQDHGYPRDDELVGLQAGAIRESARRALGIGEEQVVVLHAPTWRDQRARDYRRADLHGPDEGFDVVQAARRLGERYVLLLRGHRFHRDLDIGGGTGARILDVTAHPQVNELILAADVAVLDYSSIRFDFALTGRPMVFCVPDLERYTGGRGFLFDYRETTPGPLLRTTEEVVAALADPEALAREHGPALEAFNERFNRHQDGRSAERVVQAFFGSC